MRTAIRSCLIILFCIAVSSVLMGAVQFVPPRDPVGGFSSCPNGTPFFKVTNNIVGCAVDPGAGTGAPTTSLYWVGAADGTLSAEKNLAALATGLVINTAGTPSTYPGATCTNQFPRSLDSSGTPTCNAVALTDLNFTPALQSSLDTHTNATTSVHGIANTANLLLKDGSVATDKSVVTDTAGSPVANRQLQVKSGFLQAATTGGVEGRYISKSSIQQPVLGTDTTGPYVGQLTAGTNITLDNCTPGAGVNCTINSSGGGSSNEHAFATLSTRGLGNITLSGEQTIDGTLTSGTRVLVTDQADATQNGPYTTAAGAWTRTTDADAGSEFAGQWNIFVLSGTRNAGSRCTNTNTTAVTLGSTSITFSCDPGAKDLSQADYDVANGVPKLRSDTKIKETELSSVATHAAQAAATPTTITALIERVVGSGGPVDLSASPQIVAGVDGQIALLPGTSSANTVQYDNGTGLRLCGNKGSTIVGLDGGKPLVAYNSGLGVWEELICPTLQKAYNTDRTIYGATDASTAVQIGTDANNHLKFYGNTIECLSGGSACDILENIPAAKNYIIQGNGTEFEKITVAGVHTYSNAGRPVKTIDILAAGMSTDGTNCAAPVEGALNTSKPKTFSITCTNNAASLIETHIPMPKAWDGGTVKVRAFWYSATAQASGNITMFWGGQCVRSGDQVANTTATGTTNTTITFGNQVDDYRNGQSSAITLSGTCTGGGVEVFLEGYIKGATITTIANAKLTGIQLEYSVTSRSDS